MIQTYYGDGKGKTTAAIGSAVRFNGCGHKVLFVQFLKNNDSSEINVLKSLQGVEIICSEENYKLYDNLNKECDEVFVKAYNKLLFDTVKKKVNNIKMVVLDEILDAVQFGYVEETLFLEFLESYKNSVEFILTGHSITEKIAEISDYVSEIKEVKHPYAKGALPRKGIEF